ncbi:MAG: DUF4286 family protein [Chitinophagaceae bacterium]|nr:MAG: DUF4286 family protein [Chitinophagaceae bacterium]
MKTPNQTGLIYNVTTKVDIAVADKWLSWIKDVHIPDMMSTGCFTHTVILRLLDVDETEGPTYALQYHCKTRALYQQYIEQYAHVMRKQAIDRFGESVLSFRSVLEVVD